MITGLTSKEQSLIHESVITRIRTVERLIDGWERHPDEYTPGLIESYSKDLEVLIELENKLSKF